MEVLEENENLSKSALNPGNYAEMKRSDSCNESSDESYKSDFNHETHFEIGEGKSETQEKDNMSDLKPETQEKDNMSDFKPETQENDQSDANSEIKCEMDKSLSLEDPAISEPETREGTTI